MRIDGPRPLLTRCSTRIKLRKERFGDEAEPKKRGASITSAEKDTKLVAMGPKDVEGASPTSMTTVSGMAVRRAAFVHQGVFHEMRCDYPSLDWVSLAK